MIIFHNSARGDGERKKRGRGKKKEKKKNKKNRFVCELVEKAIKKNTKKC